MLKQTEKTQAIAAAKAGMSEKTARKYLKSGQLPSQMRKSRDWRTRVDPFEEAWPELEKMLEKDGSLQGVTLFDYLCRKEEGKYQEGQLRTLQRRVKKWKAEKGPAKEVMFAQVHQPGVQCQSDFTVVKELGITIQGQPFEHLLYHFVLTYSNWEWGMICYSESYEALKGGLQKALWRLGGVPKEHRTDNLSAAVNNLKDPKEFTRNYEGVLAHYGLKASRNHPGKGHENGDVEQSHYRLKSTLDQELRLRGSRDFATVKAYEEFLESWMERRNQMRQKRLEEELKVLGKLPIRRLEDYSVLRVRVTSHSTISVKGNIYSVDSRLIKEWVAVRVFADGLEVWFGQSRLDRLPRFRGKGNHYIQYRHIIDSLVRKPGAFVNYRYKKDLFPRLVFRVVYDWLREHRPAQASREYVHILALAAKESEELVDRACRHLIRKGKPLTLQEVKTWMTRDIPSEQVMVADPQVDLEAYDCLLEVGRDN